jgi:hypothetical protein
MRKELTIEHLAAYLPYRLMIIDANETVSEMVELSTNNQPIVVHCDTYGIGRYKLNSHAKPLLRPLSQLTETIEHGGMRFVPMQVLHRDFPQASFYYGQQSESNNLPYCIMRQLLMWHVDTFGLIESGLAEPIPSIEQP